MPRIQANFYLYAEDLERAAHFYQQHFGFAPLGKMDANEQTSWSAMKAENAIIWLGLSGAITGLIILIEKNLEQVVEKLQSADITVFIPGELKQQPDDDQVILYTDWGKHSWLLDSEKNVVMLFEPAEG